MKLSVAAFALAAAVLLVDRTTSAASIPASAGKCLSTVAAKIESGELDDVDWRGQAAYYVNEAGDYVDNADGDNYNYKYDYYYYNNANNEEEAEGENREEGQEAEGEEQDQDQDQDQAEGNDAQAAAYLAETSIYNQMQGLAEALGLDIDDYDEADGDQDAEADDAQDANANANEAEGEEADVQECLDNLDLLSQYVMAYDQELAETLGINDRCTFAQFYDLTYKLAEQGGCNANYYGYNYNYMNEQQNAEGEDEDVDEDLIKKIFENCQNSYAILGINLDEIDDNNEAIKDLMVHIQMEQAIASGKLDAWLTITNGNFAESFDGFLENLDIGDRDLDDEDKINIKLMLAVKSGDLTMYLLENAAYGSNIQGQDWEDVLEGFFQSIGMDDINVDQIDTYTATDIYNAAYDVEEYGCEQAMIAQFGKRQATKRGYIEQTSLVDSVLDAVNIDSNDLPSYLTDTEGNLTAGAAAGISIGAIAAVALISFGTYRVGRSYSSKDKRAPLISDSYQKQPDDGLTIPPHKDSPEAKKARKLARFRTSIV